MKQFVIVGTGYTGVYLFCRLVDKLIKKSGGNTPYKIILFEKERSLLATGLPYQINGPLIWTVNTAVRDFKLMPDLMNSRSWLKKNRYPQKNEYANSDESYIPRALFGRYLKYGYKKYKKKAETHNIIVEEHFDEVADVAGIKKNQWSVVTKNRDRFVADYLFLCLGHAPSSRFRYLENKPHFYRPIFDIEPLKQIPKTSSVYILGGQATFVDIALWLAYVNKHKGAIYTLTRNPPFITCKGNSDQCNPIAIQKLLENLKANYKNNSISLQEGEALFLEAYRNSVKNPVDISRLPNTSEALAYQLAKYKGDPISHKKIGNIDELRSFAETFLLSGGYKKLCDKLTQKDSIKFQQKFNSFLFTCFIGITPLNAEWLVNLYEKNQIHEYSGVKSVDYDEAKKRFIINFEDGSQKIVKYLIDASGLGQNIGDFQKEFNLIKNMVKKGYIAPDRQAGVKLTDFSQLINADNRIQNNLFFVGPMAPYTESFSYPYVQLTAEYRIEDLLSTLCHL